VIGGARELSAPRPDSGRGISPARRTAYEVLRRTFEHGAWTDRAFASAAERHRLSGRDLGLARWLAYGAVKRRGTVDHLIGELSTRGPDELDAPVLAALRLGLYELLFSDAVPDHAAVDQAVELAKGGLGRVGRRRAEAGAGLANAVLRRAVREREPWLESLNDSTPEGAALAHSYPPWLARMWWSEVGPESARGLMKAMNEPAEVAFRVNSLRTDADQVIGRLRGDGVRVTRGGGGVLDPPESVVIEGGVGETGRAAIDSGFLVPQSRASQAVVSLLGPQPRERVLDVCAGPGIKSTQIAACLDDQGSVSAIELDPGRAREIEALCRRAGASCVGVTVADAALADLGDGYDRALVDPPCSDLGTLASRPDARWRKAPEQVERLADLQRTLLARAARALRAGGTLVYSTCTISARENQGVVAAVLGADPAVEADDLGTEHPALASPADSRFLETRPDRDRTAGFFIARLRRRER
jgi:16S rRNA (cytosine967-C5)-methyltransferase